MGKTVTVLHPGEMGSAIAATLAATGHRVLWVSAGRSQATRERAQAAGLVEAPTMAQALRESDIALSVCPPHAALEVAREVAALGFKGLYFDANAVSATTVREVGAIVGAAGARWVDGGIIGSPPKEKGSTRIYISGPDAGEIAALFRGSLLDIVELAGARSAASAMKMCYAAWNKASVALIAEVRALARAEGCEAALLAEWDISRPRARKDSEEIARVARKAWRWVGEMEEIAGSFERAGLPGTFYQGAGEVYRRLAQFKDAARAPSMEQVSEALLKP